MQMQDHVIATAPFRHRLDRGIADHQVDHDDDGAERLRELGALVHVFHRAGSDVEVGALDLARCGLRLVDGFHAVEESVAPVHEGLRVDVLVVLGEIEPAFERLVDNPAIVSTGEAELRLDRRTEQRPAELVEALALDHDAGRRAVEGLHVSHRHPHVFKPQRLQRLEAEDIADDRCREIGDRAILEQVEVIGDIGEIGAGRVGHRVDAIALGAVLLARGQAIGPDDGPGRGRGFARDCSSRLDRVDAILRCHPEQCDHVGDLGRIIGLPVAHLLVFHDAGFVALLAPDSLGLGG